ncbi:imidazole glycerol phosphate synthase-like protein hisHF [Peziza echinospora]|nr:imidazole glycerol phosphate synthase-like protein hisHF [Peziza echinospora]
MGKTVHLLDTVSGNIRSLVNAIEILGYTIHWIRTPSDFLAAERIIFPGVGHFGHCMRTLEASGFIPPLQAYLASGKPFMGICVGLQALFEGSEEDGGTKGLGVFKGTLRRFEDSDKSVPHIGWNSALVGWEGEGGLGEEQSLWGLRRGSKYYYVHSFAVPIAQAVEENDNNGGEERTVFAAGRYGEESFVGAVARGNVFATQFHPEKSGVAGLRVLKAFLGGEKIGAHPPSEVTPAVTTARDVQRGGLTRRIIACLDVRANDEGDLVVTKGDQYDVREKSTAAGAGEEEQVRNLGKPVEMAKKYYASGADEITFLNITSFRNCPLSDTPMLEVLRLASREVFVPLTIGGGIRDVVDPDGTVHSALKVAAEYFSSGADKVSIGSDAVTAAEEYYGIHNRTPTGRTAIEQISAAYGNQAVVISIDPRRVPVASPEAAYPRPTIKTAFPGPNGEGYAWYQCTIKGGRESRPLSVQELAIAVEALGAGEILLNSIDRDGTNSGFDLELINEVKRVVRIPVIASSGAGNPGHFAEVFEKTSTDAALGAGIFHRGEYEVSEVKEYLKKKGLLVREFESEI